MALTAKILNQEATLNFFIVVSAIEFVPGADLTIKLQIFDTETQLRRIPPTGSVLTLYFNIADDNNPELAKVATLNADDRSLATVVLTDTETENLIGGSISFDLDEGGGVLKKGVIQNALQNQSDC